MMTISPKKPCRNRLCNATTRHKSGYCEECQPIHKQREKAVRQQYDTRRDPKVKKWLNSARYIRGRLHFMAKNPLCNICSTIERPVIASILEHKIAHQGNYELFWDVTNWQMTCKKCADSKTAKYDGGFGNPRKDYGK